MKIIGLAWPGVGALYGIGTCAELPRLCEYYFYDFFFCSLNLFAYFLFLFLGFFAILVSWEFVSKYKK